MDADHDALQAEIHKAREDTHLAFDAMWHAGNTGTNDEFNERLAEWREASVRYDTLIRAGIVLTLGPIGDTE
jgi:hypothetical protein